MKAYLHSYRQSPRKVRLVAGLVKGKKVIDALNIMNVTAKSATLPIGALIRSAVANAKNLGVDESTLYIKEIRVDGGVTMKRTMPRARGSAYPIKKRTSHVTVVLENKIATDKKSKKSKSKKANILKQETSK